MRTSNRRALMMTVAVAALAAFVVTFPGPVRAQEQAVQEYEIKAVFLYNFTKFVDWPPEAFSDDSAPLVMGIFGPDPFGSTFDEIVAGKRVKHRRLVIKRFETTRELESCHVLFVSSPEAIAFARLAPSLAKRPILTVSEVDGFTEFGGMIRLVMRQRKVRFHINLGAAEQAGLKISSRLLNLAEVVTPPPKRTND